MRCAGLFQRANGATAALDEIPDVDELLLARITPKYRPELARLLRRLEPAAARRHGDRGLTIAFWVPYLGFPPALPIGCLALRVGPSASRIPKIRRNAIGVNLQSA